MADDHLALNQDDPARVRELAEEKLGTLRALVPLLSEAGKLTEARSLTLDGLKVAARTSSFTFKGRSEDIRTIGEELNVETVLAGSVRRSGARVRISAELTNVSDGFNLWSEQYDRELDDIFAVQEEIAISIAGQILAERKDPAYPQDLTTPALAEPRVTA